MRLQSRMTLAACLAALLAAGPAAAAPPDAARERERRASAALLAADPQLKQKVTLACKARSLEAVLAELRQKLSLPLSAAAGARDEKLTAFLDDREAGEVLRLIAEHFGFEWKKAGRGYRLSQSELSRRAEERSLQEQEDARWSAILERIRALVPLVATPVEKLKARREEVMAKLREQALPEGEQAELRNEFGSLMTAEFPGAAVALKAFGALTPQQITELRSGRALQSSTLDGSLPPAVAEAILAAVGSRAGQIVTAPDRQVDLIFYLTRERGSQSTPEQMIEHPLRFAIAMPVGARSAWFPFEWTPLIPAPPPAPLPQTVTGDPALQRKVTLASPKRPGTPQPRPFWKEDLTTLADVAEALHRDAGLEVIADAYVRARLSTAPGETTAVQALDLVAARLAYDWERKGGVVRLRSRIAARDRQSEAPARVLEPWAAQVKAAGAASLDALAALAAALTEPQARGLYECWGWYFEKTPLASSELASDFHTARPDLLLWATLSPQQRRAALAGEALPVSRLAPTQRAAFFRALAPQPFARPGPMRFRSLTPADDLSAATLRLGVQEQQLQRLRHLLAGGVSFEITSEVKPDGTFSALSGFDAASLERIGDPYRVGEHTFTYTVLANEEPRRRSTLRVPRPASPSR